MNPMEMLEELEGSAKYAKEEGWLLIEVDPDHILVTAEMMRDLHIQLRSANEHALFCEDRLIMAKSELDEARRRIAGLESMLSDAQVEAQTKRGITKDLSGQLVQATTGSEATHAKA